MSDKFQLDDRVKLTGRVVAVNPDRTMSKVSWNDGGHPDWLHNSFLNADPEQPITPSPVTVTFAEAMKAAREGKRVRLAHDPSWYHWEYRKLNLAEGSFSPFITESCLDGMWVIEQKPCAKCGK